MIAGGPTGVKTGHEMCHPSVGTTCILVYSVTSASTRSDSGRLGASMVYDTERSWFLLSLARTGPRETAPVQSADRCAQVLGGLRRLGHDRRLGKPDRLVARQGVVTSSSTPGSCGR